MSDFSSTSVSELRKMLVESGKYSEKDAAKITGKTKLVEAVLKLNNDDQEEDDIENFANLLESVKVEEANPNVDNKESSPYIHYNSPEWHDYVMEQFTEDEKDKENSYPNIFGLRRVAENLLGTILQSGPTNISPPTKDNPQSTCVYTVVFSFYDGSERAFSAVAGASPENTDATYAKYPEAIAEVRAEARALRKALKLRVVSAEEMPTVGFGTPKKEVVPVTSTGEWNQEDKISAAQEIFITQKCKEQKINLQKFLKHNGYDYENLQDVNKGVAKDMISLLNSYQTNTKDSLDIPTEILEEKK